jgi:hypothetical protein
MVISGGSFQTLQPQEVVSLLLEDDEIEQKFGYALILLFHCLLLLFCFCSVFFFVLFAASFFKLSNGQFFFLLQFVRGKERGERSTISAVTRRRKRLVG